MRAFRGKEVGASLVELMIGLGILSIIGTFSAQFFSRLNKSDAESTARLATISQLTEFANAIDRDLKFRVMKKPMPALCPGGNMCSAGGFRYDRLVKTGTTEVEYQVRIENACVPMPAKMSAKYINLKANKNLDLSKKGIKDNIVDHMASKANTDMGACLMAMNCGPGQLMQTRFRANIPGSATTRPLYPNPLPTQQLLNGNKTFAANIIAAAACAVSTASGDRVILEGIVLQEDSVPRIERKEIMVPHGNVANIQMLPN